MEIQKEEILDLSEKQKPLPVGCIIMASGLGKRFRENKLLADFQGRPLIGAVLSATAEPLFARRAAVTRQPETAAFCRSQGVFTILHDLPGRNDTIRLGLEYLLRLQPDLQGCCFCPADQPLLGRETLMRLLAAFAQSPDRIHRPGAYIDGQQFRLGAHADGQQIRPGAYTGGGHRELQPGSPVFFPKFLFPELLRLPAGKGGSVLIRKYPQLVQVLPVRDPRELWDVDTPEDLRRLTASLPGS